jgi:hypothetical protein
MGKEAMAGQSRRTFRIRAEMLFNIVVLAAATAVVAFGSRTQNAHGILPVEDREGTPAAISSYQSPLARAAAEKQIALAETTWTEAHRRGDSALLRRLLATEFTFTDPTGRVSSAKEYLAAVTAVPAVRLDQMESRDTRTRVYGGTAVVSGQTISRGRRDGRVFEESVRFLRVYVNRDGRWQMVAGQDTPIPSGATS